MMLNDLRIKYSNLRAIIATDSPQAFAMGSQYVCVYDARRHRTVIPNNLRTTPQLCEMTLILSLFRDLDATRGDRDSRTSTISRNRPPMIVIHDGSTSKLTYMCMGKHIMRVRTLLTYDLIARSSSQSKRSI